MGCVSSTLLNQDEDFSQIGGSAVFSHHIVSLTSTTYGFLTLDPPPPQHSPIYSDPPTPPSPPRVTLGSLFPSPLSEPRSLRCQPLESINSWDLMSGLDADHIPSFRLSPSPLIHSKPSDLTVSKQAVNSQGNEENLSPNVDWVDRFELICPPNGENKVVIYTTTLRGVRKTFDECNAVRSAIEGVGVLVHERDMSMDRGFRDELRELMKGRETNALIPPRVFVKGRYVGGFEEVMKMVEDELLGELVKGLGRSREGYVCEGCGGARFRPCFRCNGSCKTAAEVDGKQGKVRCSDCNENGLMRCPICT